MRELNPDARLPCRPSPAAWLIVEGAGKTTDRESGRLRLMTSTERDLTARAKLLCGGCSERMPCLEKGLKGDNVHMFVWGGHDPTSRRKIKRLLAKKAKRKSETYDEEN